MIGKLQINLPLKFSRWLFGEVDFIQKETQREGRPASEINFQVKHPLVPLLFTYHGTFQIKEQPHD